MHRTAKKVGKQYIFTISCLGLTLDELVEKAKRENPYHFQDARNSFVEGAIEAAKIIEAQNTERRKENA